MKKILIYFTQFKRILGGSDYLPLLLISELQKEHEVTVALDWKSDIACCSEQSGIHVDLSRLKVEYVKPKNSFLGKLDSIIPFYRTWRLKALAKQADICISTINMFDFGKPAHHFVYVLRHFGDNAFNDYFMHAPEKHGLARLKQKLRTLLGEYILRPLLGVRSTRKILADPREKIYPNSFYVERVMREFYGPFNSTVFYPPTVFEATQENVNRNPLKVAYMGRLFPEKKIVEIIGVVEKARELTGLNLEMHIAGHLDPTPYVEKLKRIAEEKPWVHLAGPLYSAEKEQFLLGATYAIHAERDEAFGIAVAEYLKTGLLPLVPDEGGTPEIVDNPELTYTDFDAAARILARLLTDEPFRTAQLQRCRERAMRFTMQTYMDSQKRLLEEIFGKN